MTKDEIFSNKSQTSKFTAFKMTMKKLFFKRITTREMVGAGMAVALLIVSKYIEHLIPKINAYAAFEPQYFVGALLVILLPFRTSLLSLMIVPFVWLLFGETIMPAFEHAELSFFLEYWLPMVMLSLLYFNLNKFSWKNILLILILSGVVVSTKLFFHVFAGVVCWKSSWSDSLTFNAPILTWTMVGTPVLVCLMLKPIYVIKKQLATDENAYDIIEKVISVRRERMVKKALAEFLKEDVLIEEITLIHYGYTNKSYKVRANGGVYQVRFPKQKFINWKKEQKIYKQVHKMFYLNKETGILIKPWIEGKNPTLKEMELNKENLKKSIDEFHKLNGKGIDPLPWFMYEKYHKKLNSEVFEKYKSLVLKYANTDKVVCHTDIHTKNLLIQDDEFTLIDFEYCAMADPYVDYALMYVKGILFEGIDAEKVEDFAYMNLVLSRLWMYSLSPIIKMRKKKELQILKMRCEEYIK